MDDKERCKHEFVALGKDKNSPPKCEFCGSNFRKFFGSKAMHCKSNYNKECNYAIHENCIPKLLTEEKKRSLIQKKANISSAKERRDQVKPKEENDEGIEYIIVKEEEEKEEESKMIVKENNDRKDDVNSSDNNGNNDIKNDTEDFYCDDDDDDVDDDDDDEEVEHIEEEEESDDDDIDTSEISDIGGFSGEHTKIVTQNELRDELIQKAEELSMQLALSVGETQLLLSSFKWSEDKLQNAYFDDIEKCQRQAGLIYSEEDSENTRNENDEFSCVVCMEDVPMEKTYALGCGHRYCTECWKGYLKSAFSKFGPNVFRTTCMYPNCKAIVTFETWKNFTDKENYDRYWYFSIKNFVEQDKKYIICPSCDLILYNNMFRSGTQKYSSCKCGKKLCFNCGTERHTPATCDQLKKWREKELNDDESIQLLKATTKPCFHCGFPTERNQGCNHMTCQNCKGEWCWMCRGDWKTHGAHTGGFYSCNKYKESEAKKIDDWANGYLEDTSRYKHYYERYFNHNLSQNEMERKAQYIKAEVYKYSSSTGKNYDQYIEDALNLIIDCREFLKFSYVYGFFLEDPKERAIFEFLQSNAEGITERLASMITKPPKEIPIEDLKNLIRATRNYLKNLTKGTEEGLLK